MSDAPIKKRRGLLFRMARALALVLLAVLALIYFVYILPFWGIPFNQSRHGRVPLTPPWALECWLWEDDVNTEAYVKELLDGYAKCDFPVRTILIDSPWSWQYNDFKVDEDRYPEPEKFFRGLQDQGYRVVLWMTCMVNSQSKDTKVRESRDFYEAARSKGYLAGNGYQVKWWKGKGGFIDYSSPEAMKWWHGLQQQVIDWGVDGWKLDGCDTFFSGHLGKLPVPFNRAHSGWLTTRQYMDYYAREELRFGLSQNPEFVIMVRAKDQPWSHPEGFSPLDAATVTWVGDNRHTWNYKDRGIEGALTDILSSARLGYCVIGSDVAGYHGRSNPDDIGPATAALLSSWKPKSTTPDGASPTSQSGVPLDFLSPRGTSGERAGERGSFSLSEARTRPASQGSNTPASTGLLSPALSSKGGEGEAQSSARAGAGAVSTTASGNDEIAPNIYIRWAEFSAFCGFFLNGGHGERRMWKRTLPELEIVRKFSWLHTELVPYMYSHVVTCHNGGPTLMRPLADGEYHYLFGDDFLVAPIHQDSLSRTVSLPAGQWRYLFDDREVLQGPAQVTRNFPLDEYPVFIREGAVVPMKVTRAYTGFGDNGSAEFTTWVIYPNGKSQFTLFHPEKHPNPTQTTVSVDSADSLRIEFSGTHDPHILRIFAKEKPSGIRLDGAELPEGVVETGDAKRGGAWRYDEEHQRLMVTTRDYNEGKYVISWRKKG